MKITINLGFISASFEPSFTDEEKENWKRLLIKLEDYRILSSPLNGEYVGEVMEAVARLRDSVLPAASEGLPIDIGLQKSYASIRRSIRDFLVSVRPIGREFLFNKDLSLSDITPIGYQWTFISALQSLRDGILKEVEDNCLIFGLDVPQAFSVTHRLPENIANEWALEVAPEGCGI